MITVFEQMWHSLDNLLMWVSIILNETDITITIIIMMVPIMMEEVAKSVILFHAQVFLSVNIHWSTDMDNKAEISKYKTINKNILRLGSSKAKKKKWNNYDLLLAFNK